MSKYEKVLDEVLGKQYDVCDNITDCTKCCVFEECVIAFGDFDANKHSTEEEFITKIKEVFMLKMEE